MKPSQTGFDLMGLLSFSMVNCSTDSAAGCSAADFSKNCRGSVITLTNVLGVHVNGRLDRLYLSG